MSTLRQRLRHRWFIWLNYQEHWWQRFGVPLGPDRSKRQVSTLRQRLRHRWFLWLNTREHWWQRFGVPLGPDRSKDRR